MPLPFADEVPYFKTGTSAPSTWLAKAKEQLVKREGRVVMEALAAAVVYGLRYDFGG